MNRTAFTALKLTSLLIVCLLAASVCACVKTDDLGAFLPDLINKAEYFDDVFWGKGLEASTSPTAETSNQEIVSAETSETSASGTSSASSNAKYVEVSPDSPYHSTAELRTAASEVFSEAYMKIISEIAFDGTEQTFARYNDSTDGKLQVNTSFKGFDLRTTMYPEKAYVVRNGINLLEVAIPCDFDGAPAEDYHVTLVKEDGVWKVDSPTY